VALFAAMAGAGADAGRHLSCPNPACGASVRPGRARCPRCGAQLDGDASAPLRLESMRRALERHSQRFARLAVEAEGVLSASRQTIDGIGERSRRELDEELAASSAVSLRTAVAEFTAATKRVRTLAEQDPGVRVGAVSVRRPGAGGGAVEVPLKLPLLDRGHVVVRAPVERRPEALGVISGVLLEALASRPPGEVRFRIFDPVGTGSSLSAFGEFDRERVAHGLPISGRDELGEVVEELSRHATTVSAAYLRGRHGSLGEFLDEAGPGLLSYELLVLLDLPRGIDSRGEELLSRLATHAASRGISIVAHVDDARGSAIDLGPTATELVCDGSGRWRCAHLPAAAVALDEPPAAEAIAAIAARPAPPPRLFEFGALHGTRRRFTASSAEGLEVPVGMAGLEPVSVRLDDDVVHGLIAGDTGSGKSNLLRVLIYGLAHDYPPSELEMYLLDFKEGVEFREFAATDGDPSFLPHARVVSVNSDRAFGVEVLEHLVEVARRRYRELGSARNLADVRARRPELSLPRLLLVVDEFQVLLDEGDLLAERAVAALTRLASQGRAAGIHFLLSTQAISDVAVGTVAGARIEPVYKNARLRIGLRLGESESRALLRMGNVAAASIRERGEGIVNHEEGLEQGNVRTRFAYLPDERAREERRQAVSLTAGAARPPRIFDGDGGADPSRNAELRRGAAGAVGTWIGAAMSVSDEDPRAQDAVYVALPADANRHLAVIGAGAASAAAVLQWAAVGFARRCAGQSPNLLIVDFLRDDDDVPPGLVDATVAAVRRAGAGAEVTSERDAATLLPRLERFALASGVAPGAVVVFGFDRIRGLGGEPDFDPDSPQEALRRILADAGAGHTHLLCWWSSHDSFAQQAGMLEASFGARVYLGMSSQQMQLIAPGQMDRPVGGRLAYWHDHAAGEPPRCFQVYEPFGSAGVPEFLCRG